MTTAARTGVRRLIAQQAAALRFAQRLASHQPVLRTDYIDIPQASQRMALLQRTAHRFDFAGRMRYAPQRFWPGRQP
ncbi:Uncharacterised protein [Klebsiella pneumoniae]|nr:Uncharacterised protein [Klebsiella pneumoniae]